MSHSSRVGRLPRTPGFLCRGGRRLFRDASFLATGPDWSAVHGIDFHLIDRAVAADKKILELESIESSLWSADLSAEVQEVMLAKLLADDLSGITFPWE